MAIYSLKSKEVLSNLTAPANIDLGAMIPIATVLVGSGGQSTVTFSNIPQTYEHLQVRAILSQTSSNLFYAKFNSVGGTSYSDHYLLGSGTGVASSNNTGNSSLGLLRSANTTAATDTNMFTVMIMDILDYANTNKYKTTRTLAGIDTNGGTNRGLELDSGLFMSTNAITQIDFNAASTFLQYSHFALYGIKRAGA